MKSLILFLFVCFITYTIADPLNLVEDYNLDGGSQNAQIDFENESAMDEELRFRSWSLIFPGTKWCGDGDIAESYDDLGIFREVDICCRDHDHCEDIIEGHATSTVYNLTNPIFHTRLHCNCDYKFLSCLKESDQFLARRIGFVYFNTIGTQCFREDHPATCESIKFVPIRKCIEYSYDTTQRRLYQWFDVPEF